MARKIFLSLCTVAVFSMFTQSTTAQAWDHKLYDKNLKVVFSTEKKPGESDKAYDVRAKREAAAFMKNRSKQEIGTLKEQEVPNYDANGDLTSSGKMKVWVSLQEQEDLAKYKTEKAESKRDNEIVSLSDYKIFDDKGNVVKVIRHKDGESLAAFEKRAKKEGEDAIKELNKPKKDTEAVGDWKNYDANGNVIQVIKPKEGETKEQFEQRAMKASAELKAESREAGKKKDINEELTENYTIIYNEKGEDLEKVYQRKGESNKDFKMRVAQINSEYATGKRP